jgi:hypothetical protein
MDKLYLVLSALAAAAAGGLIWKFFHDGKQPYPGGEEAAQAKEKKQDEIKNTPAADLVAADPSADKLRSDAAGIAGRAKQRLRDKTGTIVSRFDGTGTAGGGGNGN